MLEDEIQSEGSEPLESRTNGTDWDWRAARPFVKWVGGKNQLIAELAELVVRCGRFRCYHEPFVGGGALLFFLCRQNGPLSAWIGDTNDELVTTYRVVRDDPLGLVDALRKHKAEHSEEYFYSLRKLVAHGEIEIASRFIYLNKTCYNGLYRVNKSGGFNVPFGRNHNPSIFTEEGLVAASSALERTEISCDGFENVLDNAVSGDLVYFDPPYVPLSKTSSFTSYTKCGFSAADQERLADVAQELSRRDVRVIVSNSATDKVLRLYPGFRKREVKARRSVNSNAEQRGHISELLLSNF